MNASVTAAEKAAVLAHYTPNSDVIVIPYRGVNWVCRCDIEPADTDDSGRLIPAVASIEEVAFGSVWLNAHDLFADCVLRDMHAVLDSMPRNDE